MIMDGIVDSSMIAYFVTRKNKTDARRVSKTGDGSDDNAF